MQVAVFGKSRMTPRTVNRDAHNFSLIFLKLGKDLVVKSHLVSAHRAPIRGIEGQYNRLTSQIAEGKALIRSHGQSEVRGGSSGSKNVSHVFASFNN
jgi:hypothetical protein